MLVAFYLMTHHSLWYWHNYAAMAKWFSNSTLCFPSHLISTKPHCQRTQIDNDPFLFIATQHFITWSKHNCNSQQFLNNYGSIKPINFDVIINTVGHVILQYFSVTWIYLENESTHVYKFSCFDAHLNLKVPNSLNYYSLLERLTLKRKFKKSNG